MPVPLGLRSGGRRVKEGIAGLAQGHHQRHVPRRRPINDHAGERVLLQPDLDTHPLGLPQVPPVDAGHMLAVDVGSASMRKLLIGAGLVLSAAACGGGASANNSSPNGVSLEVQSSPPPTSKPAKPRAHAVRKTVRDAKGDVAVSGIDIVRVKATRHPNGDLDVAMNLAGHSSRTASTPSTSGHRAEGSSSSRRTCFPARRITRCSI